MSISSEITRISTNVSNALTAVSDMGGTVATSATSDDLATAIYSIPKGNSIYYIEGTGSTAGTWLGAHDGITSYFDGLIVAYKIPVAGASTTTLNINNLGAVKVVRNVTTAVSTNYAVQAVLILTYTTDTSGTSYWKVADYDANTYVRVYRQKGSSYNGDYPLIASRTKAASLGTVGTESSQEGVYGLISDTNANIPTTNPYTGETKVKTLTASGTVTASSFVGAAATTSAAGLMSAADKTKLDGIAASANAYSLPTASSSTLGGVKVGSNLAISSGTLSVPNATDTTAGVTVVYPEAKCTTFTSDSGTITPAAVKKAVNYLSRVFDNGSTAQKDLPNLKWKTVNSKTPYIGYASDQTDGTFVLTSLTGTNYASGLAIGGGSGNLLWKGVKVATTSDLPTLSSLGVTANAAELNYVDGVTSNVQTQLNAKMPTANRLRFTSKTVATSAWASNTTYSAYPYRAAVALSGVTASHDPDVTFSVADATSGNFAPVADSYAGGVYIYAATKPTATITIPLIVCFKG